MTAASPSPLGGLRVLDFTRVLAGPFAGRMLCDLGADVVKVEPPEGDVTRGWGRAVAGIGGYYHQQNAGKRSLCIDLRAEGASALVLALAAQADLVIENFRSDVMPRLGLGYDALRAANPRLIMLSISGFGAGGPQSHRPAYAPVVHAEAGLLQRNTGAGATDRAQDLPWSAADTNAALHGVIALLAAVVLRQRTGLGQHIDLSMLDATLVTDDTLHFELEDALDLKGPPPEVWRAGAGPLLVMADFRHLWRLLVAHHGLADAVAPEATVMEKVQARRAAAATFFTALAGWEEVEAAMSRMNLAWGEVRTSADLPRQVSVQARAAITDVDDRNGGLRPIPQSPYRFSAATSQVRGPAAHRGEHNGEVLGEWLGLDPAAVRALADAGVLLNG